jgi:hypothetical protein
MPIDAEAGSARAFAGALRSGPQPSGACKAQTASRRRRCNPFDRRAARFARARDAGALVIVCLALMCDSAAAAELARGGPLGATFEPIGFDGADVIVRQEERVLAFGPAGPRAVLQDAGLAEVVAGGGTLALVRSRGDRDELLAGPLEGPRPVVMRCPAGQRPAPALAGAVVVWAGCDGLRVFAFTPAGQVAYDAGGSVRALAADGDRVAWVAEGGDGHLRVFTRALGDPAAMLAGDLGLGAQASVVNVAVAEDGRVRASRVTVAQDTTCTTVGDGVGARPRVSRGLCPRRVTFTAEGSVESRAGDGADGQRAAIVRRSRAGAVLSTIASYANFTRARPFATDGVRIAASLLTCRGSRLVADALATARYARPSCPVRPTTRRVTATRAGVVRIGVRCPRGCLGLGGGMDLRLGSIGQVFTGETMLDLLAGRRGHIAFRLSRGQLRGLRRRGPVTGRVSIIGNADRTQFNVRLHAPR